VMVYWPADLL